MYDLKFNNDNEYVQQISASNFDLYNDEPIEQNQAFASPPLDGNFIEAKAKSKSKKSKIA